MFEEAEISESVQVRKRHEPWPQNFLPRPLAPGRRTFPPDPPRPCKKKRKLLFGAGAGLGAAKLLGNKQCQLILAPDPLVRVLAVNFVFIFALG